MNKSLQSVINTIQAHMQEGQLIWHQPFIVNEQANAQSKKPYRGINALVTALVAHRRGYSSPFWATFNQIRALGGQLQQAKGKGVPIIFYKELKQDDEADPSRYVLRHSVVFNLDLVEGCRFPAMENVKANDLQPIPQAQQVVERFTAKQSINLVQGSPAYIPNIDTVLMPPIGQFCSIAEYYSAYFHELGHSTGHPSRLGRFQANEKSYRSKEEYSKEELVAEITAAMLCHLCGVDSTASIKNSAAYIQGWSRFIKDHSAAFVSAVNQAYRAKDFILAT